MMMDWHKVTLEKKLSRKGIVRDAWDLYASVYFHDNRLIIDLQCNSQIKTDTVLDLVMNGILPLLQLRES
jgi:hypothetical protein